MDLGLYHIENYHLITNKGYASAHGGLPFYIHNNWNYKVKSDTDDSPYWEELLVQITDPTNPKSKFNINLLSLNINEHHNVYLEGILSSGFLPTITLPIHVCLIIALLSITYLSINRGGAKFYWHPQ